MQRRQLIGACALVVTATVASSTVGTVPGRSSQADTASIEARVDRLFARWQTSDSPGCSVGVSRGGATVLERGYGRASLELGVPITPESVFHVASVTKQFTAMSVLLLARDGRLSIDDDVRRHLPEWAGPSGVTIRHLLTHTGGLRDAFLLIEMAAPETSRSMHDQLVGLLARQRGLSEEPGRRYAYNNGGYVLLAEIVKRVSGQSLRAFADARIFRPLGMRQSHLHDDVAEVVPKLATGYTRGGDGALRVAPQPGGIVGNAGLFTTVGDLLRWQRNFTAPRVGDAALIASMEITAGAAGRRDDCLRPRPADRARRRAAHRRARRRGSRRQRLRRPLSGARPRGRRHLQSRRDRFDRAGARRRGHLSRRGHRRRAPRRA